MKGVNVRIGILIVTSVMLLACGQHQSRSEFHTQTGQQVVGGTPTEPADILLNAIVKDSWADLHAELEKSQLTVDFVLKNGRSLLIEATVQDRVRIMHELLQRQANPDFKDGEGKTALDRAVEAAGQDDQGEPRVTRAIMLLDKNVVEAQREQLIKFVRRGSNAEAIGRLLRDVGVDPNFHIPDGTSPLTLAIQSSKWISVEVLANWKDPFELTSIDVNFPNGNGEKPLRIARAQSDSRIVELLIALGATE